jgi:DnaJ-domain-containing protein 1
MPDTEAGAVMGRFGDSLFPALLEILRGRPDGISEYDLISLLAARGTDGFEATAFADRLSLFQTHFILFHLLYRLRDSLLARRESGLRIECMRICLVPISDGSRALPAESDPLRDYYLDPGNLEHTTVEDIDALLASFWQRFAGNPERDAALAVLGLDNEADYASIRQRYRQLAMAHHPDRGGDKERLQDINLAMAVLARYHRP